ncbi:MAG TPA: hypothetical protein VGI53_03130 [Dyella sp.]
MKRAVMLLAMALSTTSVALHGQSSGTIQISGLILQGTCADTVAVNRSPEPRQVSHRCALAATGGVTRHGPLYTEHRMSVSRHTGIRVLDYYVDSARLRSSEQVQLLRRDYE